MQDCDQYVTMLSKIEQQFMQDQADSSSGSQVQLEEEKDESAAGDNESSIIRNNSELENVVIFQLLRDFNSNNMQVLFGRKKSNQRMTRRKNLQKMLKTM